MKVFVKNIPGNTLKFVKVNGNEDQNLGLLSHSLDG